MKIRGGSDFKRIRLQANQTSSESDNQRRGDNLHRVPAFPGSALLTRRWI